MSYPQHPNPTPAELAYPSGRIAPASWVPPTHTRQRDPALTDNDVVNLSQTFASSNINVPGTTSLPIANGVSASQFPMGGHCFYTSDGQYVYAPGAAFQAQQAPPIQLAEGSFAQYAAPMQFLPQPTYQTMQGFIQGYPMVPYAAGRGGYYTDRQDFLHLNKDLPGLENRRGSYSTTESAPGTPYYGSMSSRDVGAHILDRSPIYSTPSPQGLSSMHATPSIVSKPLLYRNTNINNAEVDALVKQSPAIPNAVPAIRTAYEKLRNLEQSLSNPITGNRNVYIRGLHPDTDDKTLETYCARFGEVETSKAIIDTTTNTCKGFGFAKYTDVRDSENCIRGFYSRGYEVGFARESFNSRLKAEGDEGSTNLYVSNLPKTMSESNLSEIFGDYKVSSSRILRDNQGVSRGVGFARFETREICENVIKQFHGTTIGDEGLLLQVRYADTPSQKQLKRDTTERRQWRTMEYNAAVYGTNAEHIALSANMPLSPYMPSRVAQIARHIPLSRDATGSWKRNAPSAGASTG